MTIGEKARHQAMRMAEKGRGAPVERAGLRFVSHKTTEHQIATPTRVPVLYDTTVYQNSDGTFNNIPGYSTPGGSDIGS